MSLDKSKNPRILFFYKKKNPFSFEKKGPKEFLYGLDYVQKYRSALSFFSDDYRLIHLPFYLLEKIIVKQAKLGIYFQTFLNNKDKLRKNDLLFTINDGLSFGLLFFKLINKLDNKIIVLIQGLHDRYKYFKKNKPLITFYKQLLDQAEIILTLSKYEKELLTKLFALNPEKVKVFYFGADLNYWNKNEIKKKILRHPKSSLTKKELVLTLGNDMHRDYQLLLDHYNLKIPLKLVTKTLTNSQQKQVQNNHFLENYQNISNQKLRQLYSQAKFVIVPLKDTFATSGLSVTLQTMAMGKPVLLAKAPALEELFKDYQNVSFYKMNNPRSFKQKLNELNTNQKLQKKLSIQGRSLVENFFNSQLMGKRFLSLLNS